MGMHRRQFCALYKLTRLYKLTVIASCQVVLLELAGLVVDGSSCMAPTRRQHHDSFLNQLHTCRLSVSTGRAMRACRHACRHLCAAKAARQRSCIPPQASFNRLGKAMPQPAVQDALDSVKL